MPQFSLWYQRRNHSMNMKYATPDIRSVPFWNKSSSWMLVPSNGAKVHIEQ